MTTGTAVTKNALDFLAGGGEMSKVILAKDWSQTSLGVFEGWPQSLRTAVSLCLASNFPISIAWGPARVQIYNDGYRPICATKHPHSMGQDFKECWSSAWPVIGEAFERAQRGETSFLENQRMFLDRNGFLEETFFTFSFSPIRDESGQVGGLFHPVTETTPTMLSERRTHALRELAARGAQAKAVEEACTAITETLTEFVLDLPFGLLYLFEDGQSVARLAGWFGLPSDTALDWRLPADMSCGGMRVESVGHALGGLSCWPYAEAPEKAVLLTIPGSSESRPSAGFLVAGLSSRLPFDEAYRGFYDLLIGHVGTILAVARGYQEERHRAEVLAELDRAKTLFFSNVSHELRTPLALILAPLEDLLARGAADGQRDEALVLIHRNALRLLKLVNALLDFSRIEAGRMQAVFEPTDLSQLTANLANAFQSAVERSGLELMVDCAALSEPVWVDHEMWEKIVMNLISNALKFTFRGRITVGVRLHGAAAELTVEDTGTGIAASELGRVFERFHRIQGAQSRTHEGTGIGLALVQELVRLHGGTISVTSQLGTGSRFTVSLPRGQSHLPAQQVSAGQDARSKLSGARLYVDEALRWRPEDPASTSPEALQLGEGSSSGGSSGGTVLLADDNADMRNYVHQVLSPHFQVRVVEDGEAAWDFLQHSTVDLVLTDIMMPRMDGFELLRRLRADARTRTIPVILLSARAGEESSVEGLGAGADDYLIKPFTVRELVARVGAHLRMAKTRKEATDVLRASEERLQAVNRDLDDFAAVVSHDLKSPLRAVATLAKWMSTDYAAKLDAEGQENLAEMLQRVSRMDRMIDGILSHSRLGRTEEQPEPVDLAELVPEVVEDLAPPPRVRVHIAPGLPVIYGEPVRLRQLLQNLIANAIKYGDKAQTEIHVECADTGALWQFSVADNGPGIEERYFERIFKIFQTLGPKDRTDSTGIGLALVKRIVERAGGQVRVESRLGEGSTFHFTWPKGARGSGGATLEDTAAPACGMGAA